MDPRIRIRIRIRTKISRIRSTGTRFATLWERIWFFGPMSAEQIASKAEKEDTRRS